jgi:hypothetical protein
MKPNHDARISQIPAYRDEHSPRGTEPEISENGGQNAPPDGKPQTPEGRKSGDQNSNPDAVLLNAYLLDIALYGVLHTTCRCYLRESWASMTACRFAAVAPSSLVSCPRNSPACEPFAIDGDRPLE